MIRHFLLCLCLALPLACMACTFLMWEPNPGLWPREIRLSLIGSTLFIGFMIAEATRPRR